MTLQFMSNMLKAADVNLESIRIESLEEDIFYAVASLNCRGQVKEVDARPSDAIALALLENKPIYVNESVMEEAGHQIPPDVENAPVGRGLSNFQNEYERKKQEKKQQLQENKEEYQQTSREENIKHIYDLAIESLFDTD